MGPLTLGLCFVSTPGTLTYRRNGLRSLEQRVYGDTWSISVGGKFLRGCSSLSVFLADECDDEPRAGDSGILYAP